MTVVNVPVGDGTRVYVNFSLSLEDGSEVDSNFGCEPLALSRETGRLALRSTFPAGKEETEVVMQLSRKFPWSPLSRPKPSLPFDFSLGENTTRIPRIGGPPTGSLVRML